jgi:voltage-gated potassium channel
MLRSFLTRSLLVLAFAVLLTSIGTVGYMTVEGWEFHDALYMTVITVTAVGYEEVHPLTRTGQYFTMALLTGGITVMGMWFGAVAAALVELDLNNILRTRATMKRLAELSNHVIICGAGRTGRQVIQEFIDLGRPFLVIERDRRRIEELEEEIPDVMILHGDATSDEKLEEAGVDRAMGLAACLSADADNLFLCLSARALRPDIMIVARGYEEDTMAKLYRAGADHVISPNISGAIQMASFILRPSVVSFLDIATHSPDLALRLEQSEVRTGSQLAGKSLAQARIPQTTGLIVIALRKAGAGPHDFTFNPVADTVLNEGDTMIVLGTPQQLTSLRDYVQQ